MLIKSGIKCKADAKLMHFKGHGLISQVDEERWWINNYIALASNEIFDFGIDFDKFDFIRVQFAR